MVEASRQEIDDAYDGLTASVNLLEGNAFMMSRNGLYQHSSGVLTLAQAKRCRN
jgi:hypothetical protein